MRHLALLLVAVAAILSQGCAAYVHDTAHDAAVSAVDGATSPESKEKFSDLAASLVGAARDKALDDDTRAKLRYVVDAVLEDARKELLRSRDDLLDATLRVELRRLSRELQAIVRDILDEALGPDTVARMGRLREELVGAPLRGDLDALVAEITPRVAESVRQSIAPVKADADATASKVKVDAIEAGAALAVVAIAAAVGVLMIRAHRRALESLIARV